jgi:hypothetical protein
MRATRQMKLKKGYTPTQDDDDYPVKLLKKRYTPEQDYDDDDYPDRDFDNGLAKLTLWVILPIVFLQLILK